MSDEMATPPAAGKTPGAEPDRINYVKEALTWQYNVIGLAGAAAFALVSGSALPLLLGAGLELMYLSLIPRNRRFQRLVRSRKYAEERRRNELSLSAMLQELPPQGRERYAALHEMCGAIRANHSRLSSTSQVLVQQMEEKLQGLLQSYLRLLYAAHEHDQYVRSTDGGAIKREAASLEARLASDAPRVQEINRKRIEILSRRLEKFDKICENRQVIDAQCAAIEDMLELMRDQSVTLRDPQELSDRLEGLVREVEHTEETVRQVESFFQLAAPDLAAPAAPPLRAPSSPTARPGGRRRVRS